MIILCKPDNFYIKEAINVKEEQFFQQGISVEKLKKQHAHFCKILDSIGARYTFLPILKDCPEQTFTRDIAFCVDKTIFICKMREKVRQKETNAIKLYLARHPYYDKYRVIQMKNIIEGGDIVRSGKTIYVGLGDRSSEAAVEELRGYLPDYNIVPIRLTLGTLHLDCVLGVLDNNAFIYRSNIQKKSLKYLEEHCNVIDTTGQEYFDMATNFFKYNNHVVCEKRNKRVNKIIKKLGYEVHPLDYTEFSKLGGLTRCTTLEIDD